MFSRRFSLFLFFALGFFPVSWAGVPVIPRPAKELTPVGAVLQNYDDLVNQEGDIFIVGKNTQVAAPDSLKNEKEQLLDFIGKLSGQGGPSSGRIDLSLDEKLPGEGYVLKVEPQGIRIKGGSPAGVFYGIQSLKQMWIAGQGKGNMALPAMTIEDAPLCGWRGVLLDTARHYQGKEFIKKFIDVMSVYKLNRLHWHMVDSDAWRLEIKKYPRLVEVGKDAPVSYECEDPSNKTRKAVHHTGHFHGGGYYTQDDVREIVAYAKERHVEIMPEIEFPAHAAAALTAYPEFSATGRLPDYSRNKWSDLFGVDDGSMTFLKDVLDETMDLFPFEMIHLGGDEAPMDDWKESPAAQARMKEMGFTREEQLQAWMFNEIAGHIKKRGRRAVGWEEIMHGGNMASLDKDAVVMPWLDMKSAVRSANHGLGVIHCRGTYFYLDHRQSESASDQWSHHDRLLTLDMLYGFDLFPEGLSEEGKKNIWGAHCLLWAELMVEPGHIEFQAYPRLTALAELVWTPEDRKDYASYYKRLLQNCTVLDYYKVNYRKPEPEAAP